MFALWVACTNIDNSPHRATNIKVLSNEKSNEEERMRETLLKYWQNYDFANTTNNNIAEGEQRFSNFIMLLNYADSAIACTAIDNYLKQWYAKPELRNRYNALIKHYLENPQSPMRNDVIYAHFLNCQMRYIATDDDKTRKQIEFKLKLITKNRQGSIATDFKYIDRTGKTSTLHSTESTLTLIIFNDPDCDNCKKIMPRLKSEPLFNKKEVKVLMIYPDENTELWKSLSHSIPEGWTDAYSPNGEITNELIYHIPAMPALYLLDAEKRVILKDAHPEVVRMTIKELLQIKH